MPKSKKGTLKPTTKKSASKRRKKPFRQRFKKWWKKKSLAQKLLLIILVLAIVLVIAAGIYIWSKLNMIGTAVDDTIISVDEEIDENLVEELAGNDSLNDEVKSWATNDVKKISSSNVKNILLVGLDTVSGCTDSMILVSVNTTTQKITMVSLYRDSYTYIKSSSGNGSFGKLNWAYSKGGIDVLVSTIENNYKIVIDSYALVNYQTFPQVIDALGGVDVYVSEAEADFLNETWYEWSLTGNSQPKDYIFGTNHLNGEMALTFCRIRRLDSDVNRTERQRRVITSAIESMKNASLTQINNAIDATLPYVKTGLSNSEILSLASTAFSSGWFKYKIEQASMPNEENCTSGYAGDQWIWIVDYEGAAYDLQTLLYGSSTIE